jgi:hypothetical protein
MPNANRIEWIGKYAAIFSALVAASIGIAQFRRSVAQSERELAWKQAEMARTLTIAMMNDEGWQAVTMLDYAEGRTFEIAPETKAHIRPADVAPALEAAVQATRRQRTETQRFITDRYDRLFFLVSQLESAVRSGLVRREDVRFPLSWYVEKRFCKQKKLILDYIAENSANEARQFLESLDAWQRCPSD